LIIVTDSCHLVSSRRFEECFSILSLVRVGAPVSKEIRS